MIKIENLTAKRAKPHTEQQRSNKDIEILPPLPMDLGALCGPLN